jgi:predicted nuclease of predicted toxin-antitoxin system
MKVLLDENVPETLLPAFDRCETWHVNALGWQGRQNGELLQAAQEAGFTAMVTTDVNLYNQQRRSCTDWRLSFCASSQMPRRAFFLWCQRHRTYSQ